MSEEVIESYDNGEIVWVKLGSSWWPGEVKDLTDLQNEDLDFKKPPLAIVKFFDEDSYEFVKSWANIFPYNCDKKNDFIKKGMASFRAKIPHMEKFPKDVLTAESKVGGNPNILSDPMFLPEKKRNYAAEIFGTPSPKNKPHKDKRRSNTNKPSNSKDMAHITHRRFLGMDDYKAYICIQYPGKDRTPGDREDEEVIRINREPEQEFNCHSCSFTTKRLEVMILHTKSHIQGVYVSSPKKSKVVRKHKREKKTQDVTESESSSSDESYRERKRKSKSQGKQKAKQKKVEPEPPKKASDIADELLAVWDDTDEEEEDLTPQSPAKKTQEPSNEPTSQLTDETLNESTNNTMTETVEESLSNVLSETDVAQPEAVVVATQGRTMDDSTAQDAEELIKTLEADESTASEPDILLQEQKTVQTQESRSEIKIEDTPADSIETSLRQLEENTDFDDPIEEKSKQKMDKDIQEAIKSCFDFDEDEEEDHTIVSKAIGGRKIPRVIPRKKSKESSPFEDNLNKEKVLQESSSFNRRDDEENKTEEVDAAFKELMEMTSVPELPEVQNNLKCEQNFHCIKTIKFPDKSDGVSSPPTKSEVATKLTNPKKRFVKSFEDFELMQNEIRRKEEQELPKTENHDTKTAEGPKENFGNASLNTEDEDSNTSVVELSKLKSQIMSKIIEEANINEESRNIIMSKIQDQKSEEVKTEKIRTPRSKILELYKNKSNKHKEAEEEVNNDVSVNIVEEIAETEIRKEVVPPKKGKWSRRGSHPKKDRCLFLPEEPQAQNTFPELPKVEEQKEIVQDLLENFSTQKETKQDLLEIVNTQKEIKQDLLETFSTQMETCNTLNNISSDLDLVEELKPVAATEEETLKNDNRVNFFSKEEKTDSPSKELNDEYPPSVQEEIDSFLPKEETDLARYENKEIYPQSLEQLTQVSVEESNLADSKELESEKLYSSEEVMVSNEVLPPEECSKDSLPSEQDATGHQDEALPPVVQEMPSVEQDLPPMKEDLPPEEQDLLPTKDLLSEEQDLPIAKDLLLKEQDLPAMKEDLLPVEQDLPPLKEDLPPEEQALPSVKEDLLLKEQDLPTLKEDLPPEEQDLPAMNEDLLLKEQDLLAMKEHLLPVEQDLPPSKEDLLLKEQDLPPVKEDLLPNEQDLPPVKEDLLSKEQELPAVEEDLLPKEQDLPPVKEDLLPKEQDLPPVEDDLLAKEQDLPPVREDLLLKEQDLPPLKEDLLPKEQDLPLVKQDLLLKEQDLPLLKEDLLLKEQDVPPVRDLPEVEQDFHPMEKDLPVVEQDLHKVEDNSSAVEQHLVPVEQNLPLIEHDLPLVQNEGMLSEAPVETAVVEDKVQDLAKMEESALQNEEKPLSDDKLIATIHSSSFTEQNNTTEEKTDVKTVVTDEGAKIEAPEEKIKEKEAILSPPTVEIHKSPLQTENICLPPKKSKKRKMSKEVELEHFPLEKRKKDETLEMPIPELQVQVDSIIEPEEAEIDVEDLEEPKDDVTKKTEEIMNVVAEQAAKSTDLNNKVEIQCASSSPSDAVKFSIQTNLSNLSSKEEMSALALATLSEMKADKNSVQNIPLPGPADSEMVQVEGNLTVVSEKDLADGQVEITSEQVITAKKPVTLTNFSMDFSDSNDDSNSTMSDGGRSMDFMSKGTEFTSKAMTKEIKRIDKKKQNAYERLELLDILEGNSDTEKKSKEFTLVPKAPIGGDEICDFEEHIPSQIVCAKSMNKDNIMEQIFEKEKKVQEKTVTSRLMERLTEAKKAKEVKTPETSGRKRNQSTPISMGRSSRFIMKSKAPASSSKPIILSEQIIKPAMKSKKTLNDIEDVEAFVIHKDPKKMKLDEEEEESKKLAKSAGKAKILQQTIITAAGEIIQPQINQPQVQTDDNIFDINSMPIVLSDEILTPESIENMPIMIDQSKISEEKPITLPKKQNQGRILGKITTAITTTTTMPLITNKTPTIIKQSKSPRILQTVSSKIVKNSPLLPSTAKPGKYIIVPQSGIPPSKYVGKKAPILKRPPIPTGIVPKVPNIPPEPSGNKIMIVTNQQGQQQRLLLTPAQQKILGYQNQKVTKTVMKGNVLQKSVLAAKPMVEASTSGLTPKGPTLLPGQKIVVSSSLGMMTSATPSRSIKTVAKRAPANQKAIPGKPQKTILIKNQHGQTVRKIQGTDDELLDKQVAEQLEAIKASSGMKFNSQLKSEAFKTSPKVSVRRSFAKKVETKPKTTPPPLTSIHQTSKVEATATKKLESVETKSTPPAPVTEESKGPDRPLNQLVIQDAVGNQTTITEGQILALPSETVDGQPQSYMLVTLDESGNLTPLNNEALMSLDPNLGLGGDLSNMVLQIDQGALSERPQTATIKVNDPEPPKTAEKIESAPAILVPDPSITTEVTDSAMEKVEQPQAIASTNGDAGQQLIVTGDPIATQKFLESLTEGTTDLANILANAEGNSILIQADGQQILINTNSDNQMLLSVNNDANASESTEGGGNPIFATQPSKNQDILAAALADTDVFQQEQHTSQSKITSQLSPNNTLYPMNVGNVLETSLTLSSPIMTPLEVPSTNNKKIADNETDILTQVPKNVDLPITITDPNISQTVANQQVASLIATELQNNLELGLPISETTISAVSTGMNSPSYVYSLPTLEDSVDIAQKPFNSSMPLLDEESTSKTPAKEQPRKEINSQGCFLDEEEGRFTLGGEMCSSLSEPPPEMFDLPEVNANFMEKGNVSIPSSLQSTPEGKDDESTDASTQAESSSEGSCEIPIQPQIVTKSLDLDALK